MFIIIPPKSQRIEWWMRWKWTETKYEEKMCVIKGEINQAKDIKSCKNIAVK